MKIALINENSQAAKNAVILKALKKVVEPMGFEVVNYGMYSAEDKARFEKYIAGQLAKIQLPNKDEAFLKEKILTMYANPVRNFLATK